MGEKTRMLSLFSGIGSPEMALRDLGIDYKLVGFSEINKDAIKGYCAIHGVSEELNLGDITTINMDELNDFDLLTHGSPCFTGETLVLTKEGFKEITDIEIGDYVIDHNNEYSKVINYIEQGKKEIWNIKGMAFEEINTTENHRFYTRKRYKKWNNDKRSYDRKFEEAVWKQCKELDKDDYLGLAINTENKLPDWGGVKCTRGNNTYIKNNLDFSDKRFWYICGRFLGDGWTKTRKDRNNNVSGIIICCGKHEDEDLENKIGNIFNYTKVEDRTTYKYQFSNKELASFLSQFGKGVSNKFVPGFVMDLPIDLLKSFLDGYFDSDSSFKDGGFNATSVSRNLVYGIGQCIAKVYKRPYSIYKSIRPKTAIIEGRTVNQKDTYTISFKLNKNKQDKAFYQDNYIWFPIKSIENTHIFKETYDITVENSHSFTANGCIVHNCQSFSSCGKQEGGNLGSNTQSSLMWNTVEIIKHKKPKYVIWENVKNVLSKKHKHNFDGYIDELNSLGYTSHYDVLNSKDYGTPMNRERIFVVSILDDNEGYEFPHRNYETNDIRQYLEEGLSNDNIKVSDNVKPGCKKEFLEHYDKIISCDKDNYDCRAKSDFQDKKVGIKISYCIRANSTNTHILDNKTIRKLTPLEFWRLMNFKDQDFNVVKNTGVSNTNMCKLAGNSIDLKIMTLILKNLLLS